MPETTTIDSMWDFGDPAASEARFRDEIDMLAPDREARRLELLTQIARALGLQRRFDEAHGVLDGVVDALEDAPGVVRVRCLIERGRVHNSAGSPERSIPLFREAWEAARAEGLDGLAVDAAHMAAIVEGGDAADAWHRAALDLADRSADPTARRWRASLWNNIGWTHFERGRHQDALKCFERAQTLRREEGDPKKIAVARWCVGKGLRAVGRAEEALSVQRQIFDPDSDPGYGEEEIGECLLALGRKDEARSHFRAAFDKLSHNESLTEREPKRIERLARLGGVH